MTHEFLSVITQRHCKRAFLDRQVDREVLEKVLRAAAHAPSTRNTQLWQVEVLIGAAKDRLAERLCADFDNDVPIRHDYVNRPAQLAPEYEERARLAGAGVLAAKHIAREDARARRAHLRDNYRFYGAPAAMIFHLPGNAVAGTFLEMGLFLQNVLLGLVASGLGSCPQYSVAGYAQTIRTELGVTPDRLIVCGLSVGYPDPNAPVNRFFPERAALEAYTTWHI